MHDINKYMIPADNIRSVGFIGIVAGILIALLIALGTAMVAKSVDSILHGHGKAITAVAVTAGIITFFVACYWVFQSSWPKSIDIPKINDEYGITVTSMDDYNSVDGGIESRRLSYLHDGAMINGMLIVKDNKAGLFAGTGDRLTPVKPQTASAATTPSKSADVRRNASKPRQSTRSLTGCYVKSYNEDGSIKELAGDCPAASTH
jgi:hypothetical protein